MKSLSSKMRSSKSLGIPKLRVLRQRQGLSLGQLADATGLRRDTITHFEAGRDVPQPHHLRRIAHVLGVSTFELVS